MPQIRFTYLALIMPRVFSDLITACKHSLNKQTEVNGKKYEKYSENNKFKESKYCSHCQMAGHNNEQCRKLHWNNNMNTVENEGKINKSCNYCKKDGHNVEECRKTTMEK